MRLSPIIARETARVCKEPGAGTDHRCDRQQRGVNVPDEMVGAKDKNNKQNFASSTPCLVVLNDSAHW